MAKSTQSSKFRAKIVLRGVISRVWTIRAAPACTVTASKRKKRIRVRLMKKNAPIKPNLARVCRIILGNCTTYHLWTDSSVFRRQGVGRATITHLRERVMKEPPLRESIVKTCRSVSNVAAPATEAGSTAFPWKLQHGDNWRTALIRTWKSRGNRARCRVLRTTKIRRKMLIMGQRSKILWRLCRKNRLNRKKLRVNRKASTTWRSKVFSANLCALFFRFRNSAPTWTASIFCLRFWTKMGKAMFRKCSIDTKFWSTSIWRKPLLNLIRRVWRSLVHKNSKRVTTA